ncbi:transporter substrate-binding domain-containing protein [Glycomyces xiaoerkulensis]|uniref:transporter substrate-binding domain-containing protein n=1 Tax=Glycomyces xiaoerkulensis TaxID=2038139 RepID=UPI0012FFDC5E|nr:transporter substrate-binding domain-containing protein [Glycomyces xiaoerkulensis]
MNTNARRVAAAIALIGTGLAAACSTGAEDDTLTVCTNTPFVPFESQEDGEYVGFDIDLMQLLADRLDQRMEVVEIDFDSIQSGSALDSGTCDIAAAGITITEQRQQAMGMSQAYYRADQAFVTTEDADIASLDDLADTRVAVQSATTGEAYADSIADRYGFEVVRFDTMGAIASALSSDSAQASIADLATWTRMVESDSGLVLVDAIETDEHYGFAVQRDDTELLEEVNAMLDQAFEDGTYAELYEQWIGEPYTEGSVD